MAVQIHRKEAVGMDKVVEDFIKSMKITAGLNTQRVFEAWDDCSGAAEFTLKRFYRDGKLYITLKSSVVRSQLFLQKDLLVEKMNAFLAQDALFVKDYDKVGYIKQLVLK